MAELNRIREKWYVIQVRTSTEDKMCRRIERACEEHDKVAKDKESRVYLRECFCPKYRTQRKRKGVWQNIDLPQIPGYVIAVTAHPAQLAEAIKEIHDMCKLLSDGEEYQPLNEDERAWVDMRTARGNRVIPMSFARKVGDQIEMTDGPLKGYEGSIVAINRSKSTAYLEFHVGPIRIKTRVGLAVLPGEK